jgi:hypothetical protein
LDLSLIDINNQAHKDDNKRTINIQDITYEKQSQTNKLKNKKDCHSGNTSTDDTDIPTEKPLQGNKYKPNDINIHPISSLLENQELANDNDMDISMTRNITYKMYKTNKCCTEPIENLIRI